MEHRGGEGVHYLWQSFFVRQRRKDTILPQKFKVRLAILANIVLRLSYDTPRIYLHSYTSYYAYRFVYYLGLNQAIDCDPEKFNRKQT